jgi:hypothetical protein
MKAVNPRPTEVKVRQLGKGEESSAAPGRGNNASASREGQHPPGIHTSQIIQLTTILVGGETTAGR